MIFRLVVYLKESLLPALLINHTQREKLERDNMSPSDYESYGYSNNTTVFQRSWTMDPAIKLIGIPRLRQLRATTGLFFIIDFSFFFATIKLGYHLFSFIFYT